MANDDGVRLTPRAEEMRRLIAEQRASGMTVAAFAARRGIKATTLFHWRHRFRHELAGREHMPALVPVRIIADDGIRPTSALADDECGGDADRPNGALPMVVELKNARRIAVSPGFSSADLRRLIEVIESC